MNPTLRLADVRLPLAGFALEVDVTLRGRVVALFGPSGGGKTSLLEVVAGLRRPERGRVEVAGRGLGGDAASGRWVPPEARRVGYVPQEGALFPHLSVRANVLYGCRPRRGEAAAAPGAERTPFSLGSVVDTLEIGPLLARPSVAGLSGGERQRVALARALLAGPELLLLDEPLAGLDAALKARVLPYLVRVRDEFAVPMLLVTHAPAEVMALCDEAVVLERGRVMAQGHPRDLFEPAREPAYVLKASAPHRSPVPSFTGPGFGCAPR